MLLGDFNTVRSPHIYNHDIINDYSPEHWQWIENNRKSRGKEFNPHALQLLIKNGFYDVFDRTKSPSGITTWSFVRVDYIWVNSLIVVHKAGKVNCALSDHYPVYADISILNPQPSPEEATLWSIEHIESFLRWVNGVAGEQRNLELAKPNLKEGKTIQIQTKEEIDYSTIFNQIISVWVQSSDYSRDIRNFFVQGQWPNFAPGHKDVFSPSIQSIAKQLLESAPLQKLIALRMFWEVMTSRSKVISIKTFANDVWLRRGIAGKLMAPYLQTRPDGSQFVANVLSSWTTHLSVAKDFDPRGEGQLIAIVPKGTKYWFVNSFGEEEYIIPGGHFDFKYHDKMRFHVLIYVPGFQDFAWPGDSKDDKIRTDFQTAVITQVLQDWFARVHIQATTTVGDITNHIVQFINENRNLMGDNFPLDPRSWGKYPLYSNIVIRRLVDALKPKDYKGDLLAPLSRWFEREFDTASANQWVLKPDNVRLPKDLTLQFIIDWVIRSENLSIRKQPDALPTTTQELRKVAKNLSTYSWLLLFPNYDAAIQTLYDIFPDPTGKRIVRKLEFLTVFKQRFLMPMYKQVMTIMQKKLSQQEQDAQLELITRSDKRIRDILHAKSVPISAMNLAAIVFQIIVEQKESERLHALNIPLPPARAFAVPPPLSGGFFSNSDLQLI